MATQIVILNEDSIKIDDSFHINWEDKGTNMPSIPNTIHCILWNNLPGPNEIQNRDAVTLDMTGNTPLTSSSDAAGDTTIDDLLTWAESRKSQIEQAQTDYDDAITAGTDTVGQTWKDYDPNYS
tara:strand:- start:191 stop:562 length:372 start_codon:yes stop_codon:yes gene_type:complete